MGNLLNMSGRSLVKKSPFIHFADPAVKAICVEQWGGATGGSTHVAGTDDEMTYEQAAAVTNSMFGTTFSSNGTITSFDELRYFTALTNIDEDAFDYCDGLTSITIPNSVTSIGEWAFSDCWSLTTITIGNGVTSIGNSAFYNCSSLASIVVESSNTKYDSRDNCNAIVETATNTLIIGCQNTTIPNSVTSINRYAFSQCTNLTSITIPGSVTSIGDNAFRGCRSLTNINIPNSVTSIGGYAFFSCGSLISVTVEATTPPTLESYYGTYGQFGNNASGRKIYVPAASLEIYKAASGWSIYASAIEAIPT